MKYSKAVFCFSASVALTLTSINCGSGNFTPPPSVVVATPNPLVARYNINRVGRGTTGWVEFGTDTTYGRQTSVVRASGSSAFGDTLTILVAGMKPQTLYHMRAHVNTFGGLWVDDDHTFTTGALPTSVPIPQISVGLPAAEAIATAPAPGVELLSLTNSSSQSSLQAVATDLQGNIIWYCPGSAFPIKQLPNGDYLINNSGNLVEVDLACGTVRNVSLQQVG